MGTRSKGKFKGPLMDLRVRGDISDRNPWSKPPKVLIVPE